VPVYLATLAGPQILDDEDEDRERLPLFLHALFFVLGFTLVFTLVGALAGLVGVNINPNDPAVRYVSGGLLIFFGLFMIASQYIPALGFEKRLTPRVGQTTSYLRSFLIGGAFTVAWTPCLSPILGSILTLAITSETAWRGALMLAVYSLGLGIPFLLLGAFFGYLSPLIRRIGRWSRIIYLVAAVILVAMGILIVTNNLSVLYFLV
jgi:cytochrome c-type biogenesis protein